MMMVVMEMMMIMMMMMMMMMIMMMMMMMMMIRMMRCDDNDDGNGDAYHAGTNSRGKYKQRNPRRNKTNKSKETPSYPAANFPLTSSASAEPYFAG